MLVTQKSRPSTELGLEESTLVIGKRSTLAAIKASATARSVAPTEA